METLVLKNKFHQLIDKPENVDLLERFYLAFDNALTQKKGVWQTLTDKQKNHILKSYEDSFDEQNLISHQQVKERFSKWLSK